MLIRKEQEGDLVEIATLTTLAFAGALHSSGNEASIVWDLRRAGALVVSLVADNRGAILGHIAFSPVAFGCGAAGWYGLAPLSVRPEAQGKGVGAALVQAGIAQLADLKAAGCVVLGEPAYYTRFGFAAGQGPVYPGVPDDYMLAQSFTGTVPQGPVSYHPAFAA